ncbi:MAG: hypothetical protein Q8L66_06815 [Caulobacter sp.]|nr:hypothetical protein [Caulobacter sp.]
MTIGRSRLWAALAALTGLASAAVTVAFQQLAAVKAAGTCMSSGAVIQFEFARTAAELAAVFGPAACRAPTLAAMDAINHLDIAAYIPAYTAFGICAAMWLGRRARAPLVRAAIAAAAVAFVADMVETTTLLQITKDLAAAEPLLPRSSTAAWIKFAALAAHALLLALLCLRATPRRRILAVLVVLPAIGTIAARIDPAANTPLMTLGFALAWMAMLLLAGRETIWPRKT